MTTIWRDDKERNIASSAGNIATSHPNVATNVASEGKNIATSSHSIATDYLTANKRLIDSIVAPKVKNWMRKEQIRECIIEACIVEHSLEELGELLHKAPAYLRNFIIPDMLDDGILLPTKPRHSPGQTYFTNPKYRKE